MKYFKLAIAAHKKNNTVLAKSLYEQHLSVNPFDFNAFQLLGVIFLQEGNIDHCIILFKKSLKIKVDQPNVWCNLAICYAKKNFVDKSIECYRKALNIDRKYITAYRDLAKILRLNKLYKEAEILLTTATQEVGQVRDIVNEKINLMNVLGRYEDQLPLYEWLEKNVGLSQNNIFNFAVILRIQGYSKKALQYFKGLEKSGLNNYQINHNIGNVYSDIGELKVAIEYYEKAIDFNALYIDSHINLNDLLWETGQLNKFLSSYITSLTLYPEDKELNYNYISSLIRTGNYDKAREYLSKLPVSLINTASYFYYMSQCLIYEKKEMEALKLQAEGMKFTDVADKHVLAYVKNLLQHNEAIKAKSILVGFLDEKPTNQLAIAYLSVCFRMLGENEEKNINNYTDFIKVYELKVPEYECSIESFCQQLNHYLSGLHTAINQPLEQTLYKGTQTRGNLFDNDNQYITSLVIKITDCIKDYISNITDSESRYSLQKYQNFSFAGSWSVRLNKEGYHSVHVHPMGWLSAVFYVELPKYMKTSSNNKEGWLKFGEPDLSSDLGLLPECFIKPKVGNLVIFPSYMWHGTVPLSKEGQRTTIAFDVSKNQ